MLAHHQHVRPVRGGFSRRGFLRTASAASLAAGSLSFSDLMSVHAADLRRRHKAMILLWMAGAPSQMETFDPKPDHENGGGTETVKTAVPGVEIAAPWENVAKAAGDVAFVRSMTNNEGNHQRASYQLHTGYAPTGSARHPALAANIAQQIAPDDLQMPSIVTVGNGGANLAGIGGAFLGVDYDAFTIPRAGQPPQNIAATTADARLKRRIDLLEQLDGEFAARGAAPVVENHRRIYGQAADMVLGPAPKVFDLADEPQSLKDRYGDSEFGRGCLLARRLVEAGVTFVEVRMGGWDTHTDNFTKVPENARQVDPAFAALIADLKDRGMLDDTLILWTGEFGRTPKINARGGRDHYPRAFNCALAGGGVRGGQVIGSTTPDGTAVADRPVKVDDLLQSCCHALGVDADHENLTPLGRPLRVVDKGEVVKELFG